jgi:hypothetical protein
MSRKNLNRKHFFSRRSQPAPTSAPSTVCPWDHFCLVWDWRVNIGIINLQLIDHHEGD